MLDAVLQLGDDSQLLFSVSRWLTWWWVVHSLSNAFVLAVGCMFGGCRQFFAVLVVVVLCHAAGCLCGVPRMNDTSCSFHTWNGCNEYM